MHSGHKLDTLDLTFSFFNLNFPGFDLQEAADFIKAFISDGSDAEIRMDIDGIYVSDEDEDWEEKMAYHDAIDEATALLNELILA